MSDGEDDRVGEVHFVGVLVDGRSDDRGVNDDRVIGRHRLAAQLHAGVFRWEVEPDVFVQDKRNPDLTFRKTMGHKNSVLSRGYIHKHIIGEMP